MSDTSAEHPETIGPYRIRQVLGEGGMGIVYLAEQRQPLQRKVALKVVRPGMDSQEVLTRFEAERNALARLDHPAIAKVFDAGLTDARRPFFVMEYIRGLPITQWCDDHGLDLRQRIELFAQVCQGIDHAHQRGILHRDIKPGNVFVAGTPEQPQVKIIDFGLAKALEQPLTDRTLLTEQGRVLGTPEYMSPEQADPGRGEVDRRSDVYSLGALLYELLVGAPPFDPMRLRAAGYLAMVRVIREQSPPTPRAKLQALHEGKDVVANKRHTTIHALNRSLGGDLERIVMCCLAKGPGARFADAGQLAAALAAHLRGDSLRSFRQLLVPNGAWPRTAAVAAVAFGLGVAVGGAWTGDPGARAPETDREQRSAAVVAPPRQILGELMALVGAGSEPLIEIRQRFAEFRASGLQPNEERSALDLERALDRAELEAECESLDGLVSADPGFEKRLTVFQERLERVDEPSAWREPMRSRAPQLRAMHLALSEFEQRNAPPEDRDWPFAALGAWARDLQERRELAALAHEDPAYGAALKGSCLRLQTADGLVATVRETTEQEVRRLHALVTESGEDEREATLDALRGLRRLEEATANLADLPVALDAHARVLEAMKTRLDALRGECRDRVIRMLEVALAARSEPRSIADLVALEEEDQALIAELIELPEVVVGPSVPGLVGQLVEAVQKTREQRSVFERATARLAQLDAERLAHFSGDELLGLAYSISDLDHLRDAQILEFNLERMHRAYSYAVDSGDRQELERFQPELDGLDPEPREAFLRIKAAVEEKLPRTLDSARRLFRLRELRLVEAPFAGLSEFSIEDLDPSLVKVISQARGRRDESVWITPRPLLRADVAAVFDELPQGLQAALGSRLEQWRDSGDLDLPVIELDHDQAVALLAEFGLTLPSAAVWSEVADDMEPLVGMAAWVLETSEEGQAIGARMVRSEAEDQPQLRFVAADKAQLVYGVIAAPEGLQRFR